MKFLLLFFFVYTFACAFGQFSSRAGFAGTMPKGDIYADVHPNFRTTSAPANSAGGATGTNVANRNDAGEDSGSSTTTTTLRPRTADEIYMTWPRENRPFDVLNRAQIEQQLHPEREQNTGGNMLASRSDIPTRTNVNVGQIASRGSFAGNLPKGDIYSDVSPVFKTGSASSSTQGTSSGTSNQVQSRNSFVVDDGNQSVNVGNQGHHHHHHHMHQDQPVISSDHIQQLKSSRRN